MLPIPGDILVSKTALRRLSTIFQETPSTICSETLDKMIEIVEKDINDLQQLPDEYPYKYYKHLIYIFEGRLEILKILKEHNKE